MQRLRAAQAVDVEEAGGGDGSANAHDGDAPGGEEAGSTACPPPAMLSNPDVVSPPNNIVKKNTPQTIKTLNKVKKHNNVNDGVQDFDTIP
jgi:hypothetical protein